MSLFYQKQLLAVLKDSAYYLK